jgi:hypothetical protein
MDPRSAVAGDSSDPLARQGHSIPYLPIILSGALAGALDIAFAFVFYGLAGASPVHILQVIASGVLGRGSFQLGGTSAALGAFFHFFIAIAAAAVYYIVSRRLSLLTRRPFLSGAIFGVAMYVAMHFVVLPLSRIGFHWVPLPALVGELCSHVFLFGMVIAFGLSRAQRAMT